MRMCCFWYAGQIALPAIHKPALAEIHDPPGNAVLVHARIVIECRGRASKARPWLHLIVCWGENSS